MESQLIYNYNSLNSHAWNKIVIGNCKKLLKELTQSSNQSTDNLDNVKNCNYHKEYPYLNKAMDMTVVYLYVCTCMS